MYTLMIPGGFDPDNVECLLTRLGNPFSAAARKARQKEKEAANAAPLSPTSGTVPRSSRSKAASGSQSSHRPVATPSKLSDNTTAGPNVVQGAKPNKRPALPPLAGIDQHVAKLRSHVKTSLAAIALTPAGISGSAAPGVLVTGSSGAGKTALAQSVAKELANDPRVLTRESLPLCAISLLYTKMLHCASFARYSVRRLCKARRRTDARAQRPDPRLVR